MKGGGVALLVREYITAVLRQDRLEGLSTESFWVELRNRKGMATLVGLYYRPPNSQRELEVQICREIAGNCRKHKVVVVGDFNFPYIDWVSHTVRGPDGLEFVKCVQENFLNQYIEGPTRGDAILDLLLGNELGQVTEVCVGEHFGSSDHNTISFNLIMDKDRSGPRVEVLNWKKAKFEEMRKDLKSVDWDRLFSGMDVIGRWEAFKVEIVRVQNLYVPVRIKGKVNRNKEPWFSRDIATLIKKKRELYDVYRKQGVNKVLEEYKKCKKILKKEIRRAKRRHEVALAVKVKDNPKSFYRYIKSKRIVRDKIGPLEDQSGRLCAEPKEMGEILNRFFASVFTKETGMKSMELRETSSEIMETVQIEKEEVLAVLRKIKVDKSPGPDRVFPRTLKETSVEIAGALAEIFKMSLSTGEVPEDWRVAHVVPLFK
ncbi:uncharacterized protein LOC134356332 [Mobula hypostoma]|uniref:uncharacterized protein LOC134356332 n=1 Tax=Mobula hypostoma TaxID=723540 RepID=UPI002FC2ECCB